MKKLFIILLLLCVPAHAQVGPQYYCNASISPPAQVKVVGTCAYSAGVLTITTGGGSGSVTSVGCGDSTLTCAPAPITGVGTIVVNQANNFAWTGSHTYSSVTPITFLKEANYTVSVNASTTAATVGGDLNLVSGGGSPADGSVVGARAGVFRGQGGVGGAASASFNGGNGGASGVIGGAGGAGSSAKLPGVGGAINNAAGNAGASAGGGVAAGGQASMTGGTGSIADATSAGGTGGQARVNAGAGGAADTHNAGGLGGKMFIQAGLGGAASATKAAGGGGELDILGGSGGSTTAGGAAATGGHVYIDAGSANFGGGGSGTVGNVYIGQWLATGNGQTGATGAVHIGENNQASAIYAHVYLDSYTHVDPTAITSGTANDLIVLRPADSGLDASVESNTVLIDNTSSVQFKTGALATQRAVEIIAPTYAFVGASTITNAATLAITGAPAQGTNATITNAYSIWAQAGTAEFDGGIKMQTGAAFQIGSQVWTIATDLMNIAKLAIGSQTTGDILYFDGSQWQRLPKCAAGQHLRYSATIPTCSEVYSWSQTISSGVTGAGTVDTTIFTLPAGVTSNTNSADFIVKARVVAICSGTCTGSVTLTCGNASGDASYVASQSITSSTTVGTLYGTTAATAGSACTSTNLYDCIANGATAIHCTTVLSGTVASAYSILISVSMQGQ